MQRTEPISKVKPVVKKSWQKWADEYGYKQVRFIMPEQSTDEGALKDGQEPALIWLNEKTGQWAYDLEDLFEIQGDWPDDY